jgi:hypothetical protein
MGGGEVNGCYIPVMLMIQYRKKYRDDNFKSSSQIHRVTDITTPPLIFN